MRAYLIALYRDWVSLLSGIASIILVVMTYVRFKTGIPSGVFSTAALICFVIANYRIWRAEHEAVESVQGPKVLIEFSWEFRKTPLTQPLVLVNSSDADALNIRIDTIRLRSRAAVFEDALSRLGPRANVQYLPDKIEGSELQKGHVANRMWIAELIQPNSEAEEKAGQQLEIPFKVHYDDVLGRHYESSHVFIYDGGRNTATVFFRSYSRTN